MTGKSNEFCNVNISVGYEVERTMKISERYKIIYIGIMTTRNDVRVIVDEKMK